MGGLIKQGPLYTTYSIIMMTITVCINEMIWFEKRVYMYITKIVYISCQRSQSVMFSDHVASLLCQGYCVYCMYRLSRFIELMTKTGCDGITL